MVRFVTSCGGGVLISDQAAAISLKASVITWSLKGIQVPKLWDRATSRLLREQFPDSVTQIQRDKVMEVSRNKTRKAQRDGASAFTLGFSLLLSYLLGGSGSKTRVRQETTCRDSTVDAASQNCCL